MLKKILILITLFSVMPAIGMEREAKRICLTNTQQAIDAELVIVQTQEGQEFKVPVNQVKLSKTLSYLIDDAGTDFALPLPNVTGPVWNKIQELLPHVLSLHVGAEDAQLKKEQIITPLQEFDGATLFDFIAAVNYLDIPDLLSLAIDVAKQIDIKKISQENLLALPKEIRNPIIFEQMIKILGPVPLKERAVCKGDLLCISQDGSTIVAGSDDGAVRIWNNDGTLRAECKSDNGDDSLSSLSVSQDGSTIVAEYDASVRILNNDGTLRAEWKSDNNPLSVGMSQDGSTIVCRYVGTVRIWNNDCTLRAEWKSDNDDLVDISQDGNTIVLGYDDGIGTMRIWNNDGTLRAECKSDNEDNEICSVDISQDGSTIVCRYDHTVRIWNNDGTLRVEWKSDNEGWVDISQDGSTIVLGYIDGTVHIRNNDGTLRGVCNTHTPNYYEVDMSQDGSTIVFGYDDGTVRILNNDGTIRGVCKGHSARVTSVSVSQDGNTIASGSSDGTVRLWNNNGTPRAVCNGHSARVTSVCISQDGSRIVSGSVDGAVRIWDPSVFKQISNISAQQAKTIWAYLQGDHKSGWQAAKEIVSTPDMPISQLEEVEEDSLDVSYPDIISFDS